MNNQKIEKLAWDNHTVNNLVRLKQCFGIHAMVGCLLDDGSFKRCKTIKDLVDIGWADERFLIIDQYWDNLTMIKSPNERNSVGWLNKHHDRMSTGALLP